MTYAAIVSATTRRLGWLVVMPLLACGPDPTGAAPLVPNPEVEAPTRPDQAATPTAANGASATDDAATPTTPSGPGTANPAANATPPTTTAAPRPSAPATLPAHGLDALEQVCPLLDRLVTAAGREDDTSCRLDELRLADEGDWGLLPHGGILVSYLPVIRTPSGWSVMMPIVDTWDSGMEYNTLFEDSELETWPSERGRLLVYHLDAVHQILGPDHDIEEPHRRTTICAREPAPVRCTPPVLTRVKRRKVIANREVRDASLRTYTYAADLTIVGDALVVRGPSVDGREALETDDSAIFLRAGRHPLTELLDRPTRSLYWR